jgi:hypothetical protein
MAEEPEDKIGSEQSIENVFTARESNCILFSWETYPLNAPVSTSVLGLSLLFIATTTPRPGKNNAHLHKASTLLESSTREPVRLSLHGKRTRDNCLCGALVPSLHCSECE